MSDRVIALLQGILTGAPAVMLGFIFEYRAVAQKQRRPHVLGLAIGAVGSLSSVMSTVFALALLNADKATDDHPFILASTITFGIGFSALASMVITSVFVGPHGVIAIRDRH